MRNKSLLFLISIIVVGMLVGWFLYTYFGHDLIKAMYEGKSIGLLNKIIEGQTIHSLQHYYKYADRYFFVFNLSIILSILGIIILFYYFSNIKLMNTFQSRRTKIILLILIIISAIGIRLLSFGGFCGSDDMNYASLAYQIANGEFKINEYTDPSVFKLRFGVLVPVAFGFKIAGPSEWVMLIYPFVLSILSIILAFLAGWAFFNYRAGFIAATIWTILPIDTHSASSLLPNLPAAFWANLGIILLYYGSNRNMIKSKIVYGILSGLALGLSWLCHETVVYLLPFVIIYMVWIIYRQKLNFALFFSTSLMVITILFIESLLYYKHTHNFFYRFYVIERNYEVFKIWFFAEGSKFGWTAGNYWSAVAKRIFKDGPISIFINLDFGLVTLFSMLAIIYAVFRRMRAFFIPIIWFLSLVFMFNFGSSDIKVYRPLILTSRYMYPLLLPATIIVSGLLDLLLPLRGFRKQNIKYKNFFGILLYTIIWIIIFTCLLGVSRYLVDGIGSKVERTISRKLTPNDTIYTDSRTALVLNFFWKYPKITNTYDFEGMEINEIPEGVYVLINRDRVGFLNSVYGYVLPKFYKDIPNHWQLKWQGDDAELYWVSTDAERSLQ